MSGKQKERCDKCRFWDGEAGDLVDGLCRRFPPRLSDFVVGESVHENTDGITQSGQSYCWYFPAVDAGEWCGEFKAKANDRARSKR